MPIKPPAPRHLVENFAHGVRVTLPSKKNPFEIVSNCLFLLIWLFMTGILLASFNAAYTSLLGSSSPDAESNSILFIFTAWLIPFLLALLAMGLLVVYVLFWKIIGKEIIEADAKILSITKQLLGWKRRKEFDSEFVADLRVSTQQLSYFSPMAGIQKISGQNGRISFDYGAKTFRFGLEIDEAEAKQIIRVLRQHLPE